MKEVFFIQGNKNRTVDMLLSRIVTSLHFLEIIEQSGDK